MSIQPSVWNSFLEFSKKSQFGSPIVYSLIKQLRPLDVYENKIILACGNIWVKTFLDKKIDLIERSFFLFSKKAVVIQLTLSEPVKKNRRPAPLLSFKQSLDDVLSASGINSKFRFDNFAVSPSNQVAYAASQAVAGNLGNAYNPLFIYGGVGVGKTHLAQATARAIIEKGSGARVFFSPGDLFTNELIESIRERSTGRFRKKYRHLKVLIIDDVQFIAGK